MNRQLQVGLGLLGGLAGGVIWSQVVILGLRFLGVM